MPGLDMSVVSTSTKIVVDSSTTITTTITNDPLKFYTAYLFDIFVFLFVAYAVYKYISK